jgi:hypothetical protein
MTDDEITAEWGLVRAARLDELERENARLREALGKFLPEADDGLVSFSEAIDIARAALAGSEKP